MTTPFLGEIEIFGFNFAPKGWVMCAGQTLPINQYQALFSLIGTTYGGNGVSTFVLPDLRGRLAMGQGNGQKQEECPEVKTKKEIKRTNKRKSKYKSV